MNSLLFTHLIVGALLIMLCVFVLLWPIQKISINKPMTKPLVNIGILVTIIILYVLFAYFFNFESNSISSNPSDWGVFGDFLGCVLNPVLSFITVIILLWNIYIQKQDNKKNNLDRMFTLMLEQHNAYIDKQEFITASSNIYSELFQLINTYNYNSENLNKVFNKYPVMNTYLRLLYRILKYLTKENQATGNYSRLLRSFCSEELLFIIAANSLRTAHNKDFSNYKSLLEKNNFLEHMNLHLLYKEWENSYRNKMDAYIKAGYTWTNKCSIEVHLHGKNAFIHEYSNVEELSNKINDVINATKKNLFIDIIKLDKSAFKNSNDYDRCIKDKMILENDLKTTLKNKIEQLDNS